MIRAIRRWSVATRLFALQLAMILGLAAVAVAVTWADARADVTRDAAERSLAIAETLAVNPFVVEGVQSADPTAELQPYALEVAAASRVDFVTILRPDRTRYTHPDPERIGEPFVGSIDRALDGRSFTETFTGTLGPSVRAVAPVLDDGNVVALVAVGITVSATEVVLGGRVATILLAAAIMVMTGALAAWALSRYLRRVTWGRGAEEMGRMLASYEGVLHSLGEGLLVLDRERRVVLMNDGAAELLGVPRMPLDRDPIPLDALGAPTPVSALLSAGQAEVDRIVVTETHVLVVNVDPVVARRTEDRFPGGQRQVGTVVTVSDHTRLQQLSGELATMTTLSDALRSQTHEFANRLHTVIALIELGRPEEAVTLASSELELSQRLADRLLVAVEEPVLLALLLGKSAQAAERGIAFSVDIPERLPSGTVPARELITIVGNLIDNAMEAAARTAEPAVRVAVAWTDGRLSVTVADSGSGPAPDIADGLFELGRTTKEDPGHGIGLALVGQSVRRLSGTLEVDGPVFTVRIPAQAASEGPA
jgi:two-component system CitB family sensor kinase